VLAGLAIVTVLAPAVSANPVGGFLIDVLLVMPILLVVINYPIDGLMLLLAYWFLAEIGRAPGVGSAGRFRSAFALSVLIFANLGALIDYFTWMLVYVWVDSDLEGTIVFSFALVAIGLSAILVCRRYLGLSSRSAVTVGMIAVITNFVAWAVLTLMDEMFFFTLCVEMAVILYLFFVVFLYRAGRRQADLPSPSPTVDEPELAMSRGPTRRQPASMYTNDLARFHRRELWFAAFLSMLPVAALSLIPFIA